MTTSTLPSTRATELFQELKALYPSLPEPQLGAFSYLDMIAQNPALDQNVCQEAGKIVVVTAKLSEKCDQPVALRGDKGSLTWETDHAAVAQTVEDFYQREFVVHVSPAEMNDPLSFKLVVPGTTPHWQQGENCVVNLGDRHSHIVKVELSGVAFN